MSWWIIMLKTEKQDKELWTSKVHRALTNEWHRAHMCLQRVIIVWIHIALYHGAQKYSKTRHSNGEKGLWINEKLYFMYLIS
jgi:hypothetical protein